MALQSPFLNCTYKSEDYTRPGSTSPNAAAVAGQAPAAQPVPAQAQAPASTVKEGESKLTVGPNIKLKGVEITDCDTLVVEGSVEATMDSRVIQISERGSFKGSADIDVAEIRGLFDGNLTVRQKLVIFATGKVTGKVRYGKIVIEEGGQLSGEIEAGTGPRPAQSSSSGSSTTSSSSSQRPPLQQVQ
jgi:cytoskeletal protein CcmA (bactofilin family)